MDSFSLAALFGILLMISSPFSLNTFFIKMSFLIHFSCGAYDQFLIYQDEILRRAVQNFKGKNWKKIGMRM